MDRTSYPTYRMGRKRWVKLLGDLQSILKRTKRLKGASRCEYQHRGKRSRGASERHTTSRESRTAEMAMRTKTTQEVTALA
jgi:hypothetical protein